MSSKKLVRAFKHGALGPVNFAGGLVLGSRVPEALREITPDSFLGGVGLGVAAAAREVGAEPRDVEALLPMAELRALAQRIGLCQQHATQAWQMHAGGLGGFMQGVADLTADGRSPDLGLCLERLSKKVSRDRPLSEPLAALAVEVTRWQDMIADCEVRLEQGDVLAKAYRRRQIKQIGAGLGLLVVVLGSLGVGLWVRAARARIDEALASKDPCAARAIADGDRGRASGDQQKKIRAAETACGVAEEARAEALAKEREAKERAEAEAKIRQERADKCAALAEKVASGKLDDADAVVVGGSMDLLARIAKGALDSADYGPLSVKLPCQGTPGGAAILDVFEKAVLARPSRWANSDPSDLVAAALIKQKDALPSSAKQVVARRADDTAKRALLVGGADLTQRAVRLCKLKAAFGVGGGKFCSGVTQGQ